MKPLLSTLTAAAVLIAIAAAPAGAMSSSTTKTCAAVGTPTGLSSKIRAKYVGCTTARSVARTYTNKGKAPKGWTCKASPNGVGANVNCHHTVAYNVQKIHFQIAD
jgi:hypothetical protein